MIAADSGKWVALYKQRIGLRGGSIGNWALKILRERVSKRKMVFEGIEKEGRDCWGTLFDMRALVCQIFDKL